MYVYVGEPYISWRKRGQQHSSIVHSTIAYCFLLLKIEGKRGHVLF